MVRVREEHPENEDGSVNIQQWLSRLTLPKDINLERVAAACELARTAELESRQHSDNAWHHSASSFRSGLEMAEILADLHLDEDALIAAIVYRAVREEKLAIAEVGQRFGDNIVQLVDGVLKMAAMSRLRPSDNAVLGQAEAQKENMRKMLVALVDDVRVALIKLAERTIAIRGVKDNPHKRQRVAREVFDVYAPLAHRLGIGHIKWELEDLSFRYLYPDAYKKIAKLLDGKRLDREKYIDHLIETLQEALSKEGIQAELSGRAKHIYSIWRKMQRKGIGFSQVYDVRAVRILVDSVKECYAVLGVVHSLWRNIPNEFDDYIANPKENGYRSLHTALIGPEGKVLEVQIRTHDMHGEAEFGVCAHWSYKGADSHGGVSSYEEKIAWLRQVLDWQEETGGDAGDLVKEFGKSQDRVYVFTPDGHVVNLVQGATPLDFAYHVHTEVGHRCRGAKVNGRIVPLTYILQTGEQVEILTGKENQPRRDWLQPGLNYLKSSRARAKVHQWFKLQNRDENISAGRALLEKVFKRMALTSLDYKAISKKSGYQTVEEMFAAAGAGDVSTAQILHTAQLLMNGEVKAKSVAPNVQKPAVIENAGVTVRGVGNLLTRFAGCCKPLPGDDIMGYITLGHGVSIHRTDCAKLLNHQHNEPQRVVQVSWGKADDKVYPVDLAIKAFDRQGLLRDITMVLAEERVDLVAVQTLSDKEENTATMHMTVEVPSLDALGEVMAKITRLPNILSAKRVSDLKESK
jgi:GTP pyrophosphokinase